MDQTFLVFGYRGARYGLGAQAVREIVWLPELAPIEELPPYIVGLFNLRGRVMPVLDLGLRFGHAHQPYLVSDRVIVIESHETRIGIIANALHDVVAIPPAAIQGVSSYQGVGGHAQFVWGEAKLEDGLAMLLDDAALLRSAPAEAALVVHTPLAAQAPLLFGKLTPQDAELLRSRARALAQTVGDGERAGLATYALIRLDGELFGLGLDVVHEFVHLRGITPIPCCPPHIVGNMNLRGDILTLVDIRPALGMATGGAMNEVVVTRIGALRLGLPATAIVDVVRLAASDITAVAVASDRAGKAYCKGVAAYGGQAVSILDLQKILAARELQVDEEVK